MNERTTIIIKPELLSPNYLPEQLKYREAEYSQLKGNFAQFVNTALIGPFASGKTAIAKKTMRELNDSKAGNVVYVDCALFPTTYSILKEILPKSALVFYRSNYELTRELRKYVKENKFSLIIDSFDRLKDQKFILNLMSLGICVVLITDSEEGWNGLDVRVRSNITSVIRLESYTADQSFDILKARADQALAKWSFTDQVIRLIADGIRGNLTLGLNALKAAALKAEASGRKVVEQADVHVENVNGSRLNSDEKVLMDIMKDAKAAKPGPLYDSYSARSVYPKSKRAFRNYMHSLQVKGLVKAVGEKRGRIYEIGGDNDVQGDDTVLGHQT